MIDLPQTFYPSRRQSLLLVVISIVFVAIGIFLYRTGEGLGLYVAIFFAACAVVIILNQLPRAAFLRVTEEGLEICTLYRVSRLSWDAIERFEAISMHGAHMVSIVYRASFRQQETGRYIARSLSGAEGVLPDTYGKSPEELANFLNRLKTEREALRGPVVKT